MTATAEMAPGAVREIVPAASVAVEATGLVKRFGSVTAVDGVDLRVPEGTVFGLLGPNGAGKTTIVRMLVGLLRPDAGTARVAGLDVATEGRALRERIGLAGQYAGVDEKLTGRENLRMFARLGHLTRASGRARADELLDRFDLDDAADRLARTYSGGMRRRLDLAAALVTGPSVVLLDEPTTGLDPRSRLALWDIVTEIVAAGTTVLLTTQYLEEADRLADRLAVIDHGRVIAEGTPAELKGSLGGTTVEIRLADQGGVDAAIDALSPVGTGRARPGGEPGVVALPVADPATALAEVVRRLDAAGLASRGLTIREPTLDDVFLQLTGRAADESGVESPAGPTTGSPAEPAGRRHDPRSTR